MSSKTSDLHPWWTLLIIALFAHLFVHSQALTNDGNLLLSFKNSVLSDPLGVLHNWNSSDQYPCSWNGVTCGTPGDANATFRVTGLSLPNSQLLASITPNLGLIKHLRILNLSNNSINGSIPLYFLKASALQFLDLSNNLVSGELPEELIGGLLNLVLLNLTNNALGGNIPENLSVLRNLTYVSFKGNYFIGNLPSGFGSVQVVDLSSNLINGSLPSNFRGNGLQYLNLSYNRLSGQIPSEFANQIPTNATIDFSYNNFTGEIPETSLFLNQNLESYTGNPELCGGPVKNPCPIPSTPYTQPNVSAPTSTPAIAAIPKSIDSSPATNPSGSGTGSSRNGMRTGTVVGIVVGDVLGVSILALVFMYVYQVKKRKSGVNTNGKSAKVVEPVKDYDWSSSEEEESSKGIRALACLRKQSHVEEESSDSVDSDDGENVDNGLKGHEHQVKAIFIYLLGGLLRLQ